jgi:16S rRNA (cytosine1402-N4)-methyltransferase
MRHLPVLLKETITALNLAPGKNAVDCTLGDAGHSEAILERTAPNGMLLGIDTDIEAILCAKRFLYRFEDRVKLVKSNFAHLKRIIEENNFQPVQAILLDLGWSSPQFEERGRGFSFQKNEPLDMRYAVDVKEETAAEILNNYSEEGLKNIFKNFGEEKFASEIAAAVVLNRKSKKIEKTGELVELILRVYREKFKTDKEMPWIGGIHPATKVFQALRIAVNKELEVLKEVLPQAMELLTPGGRLAVISFHSLEDRIVKQYFQKINNKLGKIVNKKPIVASEEEIKNNPRSRSAKLRIIEKV